MDAVQPATMSRKATGGSDNWCTPPEVLERVRRIAPIGLDPCGAPGNPTGAAHVLHPERLPPDNDGLTYPWVSDADRGLVYVNPPYSQASAWAQKIYNEHATAQFSSSVRGFEIVSLVAARPDARWFYKLVWDSAQAVCFWKGRLRFVGAPSSAPFPSAVVYHGPRPWAFEAAFHDAGKVIRP